MPDIKTRDVVKDIKAPTGNIRKISHTIREKAAQSAGSVDEVATGQGSEREAQYAQRQMKTAASSVGNKTLRVLRPNGRVKQANHTIKLARREIKNSRRAFKAARETYKAARQSARVAQQAAKTSVKAAQHAAQAAKVAARKAVVVAKAAVKTMAAVIKGIIAAVQWLIAAIAAGGWVAVLVILIICMIAAILFSPFGVFFSNESGGKSMQEVVSELSGEYLAEIHKIQDRIAHDDVEFVGEDGSTAIRWEEVLAIYAVRSAGSDDEPIDVVTIDESKVEMIREILFEMNPVSYTTKTVERTRDITKIDDDGKEYTVIETYTETVLVIKLSHKTTDEMAVTYGFTSKQNALLDEMLSDEYRSLWVALIGSYRDAGGRIIIPDTDWIPTGPFWWPLPSSFRITSQFGNRTDPVTGEAEKYHGAIDIAAPEGTPILAVAGGRVVIANATDSWAGGYGYYVKIEHNGTYSTLYAHCSAIAVQQDQIVEQGQVIAFVGTTGKSTGYHLHFEVYQNGTRVDPLLYFWQ